MSSKLVNEMDSSIKTSSDPNPDGRQMDSSLAPATVDPGRSLSIAAAPQNKTRVENGSPTPEDRKGAGTPRNPEKEPVEAGLKSTAIMYTGSDSAITLEARRALSGHPVFGFGGTALASESSSDVGLPSRLAGGESPRRRRLSTEQDPGFVQLGPRGEVQRLSDKVMSDLKSPSQSNLERIGATGVTVELPRGVIIDGQPETDSVAPEDSMSRLGWPSHTDGRPVQGSDPRTPTQSNRSTPARTEVYRQRADVLKMQRDEARRKYKELQQRFEQLEDECLFKEKDGASIVTDMEIRAQVQDFQAEIDRHLARNRVLAGEVQHKEEQVKTLQAALDEAGRREDRIRASNQALEMQTNILANRAEQAVTELAENTQQHKDQTESLRRAHKERESDLECANTHLKEVVLTRERRIEDLEKQIDNLQSIVKLRESECASAMKQNTELAQKLRGLHAVGSTFSGVRVTESAQPGSLGNGVQSSTAAPPMFAAVTPPSGAFGQHNPTIFVNSNLQSGTTTLPPDNTFHPAQATDTPLRQKADQSTSRPKVKNLPQPAKLDVTKRGFTHVQFQEWKDALKRYFNLSGYEESLWPQMVPYYMTGFAERRVTGYLDANYEATFESVIDFIQQSVLPKRNVAASYASMRTMVYVQGEETLREFYDKLIKAQQETRGIRDLETADYAAVREAFFSKLPVDYQDYIMQQLGWESMEAEDLITLAEHHEFRYTVKDSLCPQGANGLRPCEGYRAPQQQETAPGSSYNQNFQPSPAAQKGRAFERSNGRGRTGERNLSQSISGSVCIQGNGNQGSSFQARPSQSNSSYDPQNQIPSNRTGNCYNCGKPGHFRSECQEPKISGGGYVSEISEIEQEGVQFRADSQDVLRQSTETSIPVALGREMVDPFEYFAGMDQIKTNFLTIDGSDSEHAPFTIPYPTSRPYHPKTGPKVVESWIKSDQKLEGLPSSRRAARTRRYRANKKRITHNYQQGVLKIAETRSIQPNPDPFARSQKLEGKEGSRVVNSGIAQNFSETDQVAIVCSRCGQSLELSQTSRGEQQPEVEQITEPEVESVATTPKGDPVTAGFWGNDQIFLSCDPEETESDEDDSCLEGMASQFFYLVKSPHQEAESAITTCSQLKAICDSIPENASFVGMGGEIPTEDQPPPAIPASTSQTVRFGGSSAQAQSVSGFTRLISADTAVRIYTETKYRRFWDLSHRMRRGSIEPMVKSMDCISRYLPDRENGISRILNGIKTNTPRLRQLYFHIFKRWSNAAQALAFDGSYRCDYDHDLPSPFNYVIVRPSVFQPTMQDWTPPSSAQTGPTGIYWLELIENYHQKLAAVEAQDQSILQQESGGPQPASGQELQALSN